MTAGSDYTAKSGTFSFAPGVTNQSTGITILRLFWLCRENHQFYRLDRVLMRSLLYNLTIITGKPKDPILKDALTEPNETVTLTLSTWLWPRRPEAAALRSIAR